MMKMVPARRRVTDASLLPPASFAFSRANRLLGKAVVGSASITATAESQNDCRGGCGEVLVYQRFVKIWLGGGSTWMLSRLSLPRRRHPLAVVLAKARTHYPRERLGEEQSYNQ